MKNLKTFTEFVNEATGREFDPAKTVDIDPLLPPIADPTELVAGKEYVVTHNGKKYANMLFSGVTDGNYIFNAEDLSITLNLNREEITKSVTDKGVQQVNEAKVYKGREVYPDWINPARDFGAAILNKRELKVGAEYILWDPGMDTWQAEFIYQGHTGGKYIFNDSNGEAEPMDFTESELEEYISSGDILKQN